MRRAEGIFALHLAQDCGSDKLDFGIARAPQPQGEQGFVRLFRRPDHHQTPPRSSNPSISEPPIVLSVLNPGRLWFAALRPRALGQFRIFRTLWQSETAFSSSPHTK